MRIRLLLLFLVPAWPSSSSRGQLPDVPPTGREKPVVVPARPLSDGEAAHRDSVARYGMGRLRQLADRLAEAEKQFRASTRAEPTTAGPYRELAKVSAALGRDAAAIRAARRALELDPTDAETAELLGKVLAESNQFALAAKAYQQAANAHQKSPPARLRCWLRAVNAAEKAGDSGTIETVARAALDTLTQHKAVFIADGMTVAEHGRERADLYEQLGKAQKALRKFDLAVASFEAARDLALDPKQSNDRTGTMRLHQNLAEVYAAQGKQAQALEEHAKYLAFQPSGTAGYVRHVELMLAADPRADVYSRMNRLAEQNPKNPAPKWLAVAALARLEFPTAHQQFLTLATTGTQADVYPILVAAYGLERPAELLEVIERVYKAAQPVERKGEAEAAAVDRARALTTAVKAVPALAGPLVRQFNRESVNRPTPVYELVAGLGMRHGVAEGVVDMLKSAARRAPNRKEDDSLAWLLIQTLSQQKRWRELAEVANELKDLPDNFINSGLASEAAIAYAELGDERRAREMIRRVEGRIIIRLQTARVWTALGQPRKAVTECEEILEKDRPRGAELRSVRLAYSTALLAVRELDKAEAQLRAILEDDPDDIVALNNLGYNLADQGRKLPEAEELVRRAIELDEFARRKSGAAEATSGTYLDSLAWVLFRRGKAAEARLLFERVITTPDASHDPVVWDHYGDVCFRLGDKPRAKLAWQKADGFYADSHQGREAGRREEVKRKLDLAR